MKDNNNTSACEIVQLFIILIAICVDDTCKLLNMPNHHTANVGENIGQHGRNKLYLCSISAMMTVITVHIQHQTN